MAQKDKKLKLAKKVWVEIVSPSSLGSKKIGESYLFEPKEAVGRVVSVNLMTLTGDVKHQQYSVEFEISDYKDNKLQTKPRGYNISSSSIKRLIRRYITRIDDSIVAVTSDNVKVRVKPLVLTRGKTSKSVEKVLRHSLREEIVNFVKNNDFETLFMSIVKMSLQKDIKDKLNKIYPIKNMEIKQLKKEKPSAKETEIVKKVVILPKEKDTEAEA